MDRYDFVIIGAGGAGEAAAHEALRRKKSVAIVDRELFGGSCPFWACMPSKSLLHSAAVHAAGGDYPWAKASDQRDYMINRVNREEPDDGGHVHSLQKAGATVIRGDATIQGPGRVGVRTTDGTLELTTDNIVVAVGSNSRIPSIEGLLEAAPWTNREATSARELPASLLVLGGGPTGVELAQVYASYGVPVTIVEHGERLISRDHPRNSAAVASGLKASGVTVKTGRSVTRIRPGAGPDGSHVAELDDGSQVTGHRVLLSVGRTYPLDDIGLEKVGIDPTNGDSLPRDGRLRLTDGLYLIGDAAGPEMHTHLAHYQGEMAVGMALGEPVRPDYRAIPRATYTTPEVAFVGVTLDQAREAGLDAFEVVADLAKTAKGFVVELAEGHVTIVVDRTKRTLIGAAIAGPGASEAIHEAVLAIKAEIPIGVLADTIHAFPTTARVLGSQFVEAARRLESEAA
ncbi:MAG TPA: NAD(P)/FAD-dependent oxidoreductase [Candidatus Saccharimonadales bacterium]|nr:NAD(P)/FAD-dependent oxidoreductase [Candidatus Saccharimonadales bacterium]